MILTIDTRGKDFVVTRAPTEKLDQNGQPRTNKQTGEVMWSTQLVVTDESGGEVISVNTDARPDRDIRVGDVVDVSGLVAIPWNGAGRSGVAYRAQSIKPAD